MPADLLLIGGTFFGYGSELVAYLTARGRNVLWFDDRPAADAATKAMLRLAPGLMARKTKEHAVAIRDRAQAEAIRDVLVIKGEGLSGDDVGMLRRALPSARFILYFWDSYGNMPKDSPGKVAHFDRAFTFDPRDAERDPRLAYRPLFFLDEFRQLTAVPRDIDLLFFGTAHTDRYMVLMRLAKTLPPHVRLETVLYPPSRLIYAVRRSFDFRFWGARRRQFIFKPLDRAAIRGLMSRARAIIDIERAVQSGLTMRCVEAFGAGRKIITTNPSIAGADFYHPDNIAVVDRERPRIPEDFLDRPYAPVPPEVIERYTLARWVSEVLGL